VPYYAAALAKKDAGWTGHEVELGDVEDLDGVTDLLRELASGDDPVLLFVEENDEWFGVVRVDGDADPRVFLSDERVAEHSDIGSLLSADAVAVEDPVEDNDDESMSPEAEPAGDTEVLSDLGTSADRLLELCAEEGMLPSDVISTLCENAGCLEEYERIREG
jgi:putative tRNA adenosine deaminase-associated protein